MGLFRAAILLVIFFFYFLFFFSSRRRHTRLTCDWSSDVCSSDLGAPPLAMERPGHAQDERGAVAGQQAARRPQDRLVLEEFVAEIEQGAADQTHQDLGDREAEIEYRLAEDLEREQHRGHVQARIPEARPEDAVLAAAERHLSGFGRHGQVTQFELRALLGLDPCETRSC